MKMVVALGGNAIAKQGAANYKEQLVTIKRTCKILVELIKAKHTLIITHGNGPQVGNILLQQEKTKKIVPSMPLDVLGAESQGEIGYLIQQQLDNELRRRRIRKEVVTVVTQVIVHKKLGEPTKPIGPFYRKKKPGFIYQMGKGWRKVVPSPKPLKIVELKEVKKLINSGAVVITCGGGGIPVIKQGNKLIGVEGVIDKDRAAQVLATSLEADLLLILTDVQFVYLNYGKKGQQKLCKLKISQAKKYLSEGQFAEGSMGPKIEACIKFIEKGGKKAIIGSLGRAKQALEGKSGTIITK